MTERADTPQAATRVPPIGIALVVCDNVYQDSTGKRALVGLFNRMTAPAFPATHSKLCVFVTVTEVLRFTECKLDIVNAETEVPIIAMGGTMPDKSPIAIFDMVFKLQNLVFPEAGTYYVRFFGNEQILLQRPIELVKQPNNNEHEE